MATLAVTTLSHPTGVLDVLAGMTAADAGGTDKWPNPNGNTFLLVNNGGGALACVVTMVWGVSPPTGDGIAVAARTYSVAFGKWALLGPFPAALFNDASGFAVVLYSQIASVKVVPLQLGT